jgi:hypothetical protein
MVAIETHHERSTLALMRIRDIVEAHGNDEQKERLARIMGRDEYQGKILVPSPKFAAEFATFQAEAIVILFELVAELKEASKPRPRGRPPKKRSDEAA